MCDYLYHYTSIETLALILSGKKLRFNNLLNVDDPEEAVSKDLGNLGKYVLVNCWTANSEDILPMWSMYTKEMKGVRIKMKKNPFKKYYYSAGQYHFKTDVESCIDYSKISDKGHIVAECPTLVKVEYVDDEEKLIPQTKFEGENRITIALDPIGKYKRKYWAFQQEVRYKITAAPYSLKELEKCKKPVDHCELMNRILDEKTPAPYKDFFLELRDDAFDNMEILLGPKTTVSEDIIVKSLVEKYCDGFSVKVSKSRIKIK